MSECIWAPCRHAVPAAYLLTLERPCGHGQFSAPSCIKHAAKHRAEPVARRATKCTVCGETNPITVIGVRTLRAVADV